MDIKRKGWDKIISSRSMSISHTHTPHTGVS